MSSALKEIGIRKAFKFFYTTILMILYEFMIFPPMRTVFLRLCGAKIGKHTIINKGVKFINLYRTGFKGLAIGDYCFISDEAMFDLADKITIGNHSTLGQRTMIITHINVGYSEHPLQKYFPSAQKGVIIKDGVFIGPYAVILPGVVIGENSLVMVKSLVTQNVPSHVLYGGIPGRVIKKLEPNEKNENTSYRNSGQ
ncbi:MAG: acyltransferase [candidate division WOR-3 bacterium]